MSEPSISMQIEHGKPLRIDLGLFILLVLSLEAGAIVRSAVATRLDGFTIDEAYHIGAVPPNVMEMKVSNASSPA